jgi:RNA polymerase sigma-70 factor (ECF subfamily)
VGSGQWAVGSFVVSSFVLAWGAMAEKVAALEDADEVRDEAALIRRIRDGERELYYELIHPYERRMYAAAFALLRNPSDAEDVAQEAALKALKNIGQFRGDAKFSTWLIQITVNEARMWRRKGHAHMMEPIAIREDEEGNYVPRDFADWHEIPSETLERKEVRQKLAEALASLGQIYREVFVLRDMQQLSIEETAKALGISTASVKTRLLRARLMLRDLLSPGLGGSWSSRLSFEYEKGTKPW